MPTTIGALRATCRLHPRNVPLEPRHALVDAAAVELDLGLTGASCADSVTAADPPAGLPGHRFAPAAQAGKKVLELGKLNLGFAFTGLGVLGEDIEDQSGPVDNLSFGDIFKVSALVRRQLRINDDSVRIRLGDQVSKLSRFARTKIRGVIGLVAPLEHSPEHDGARCLCKGRELSQRHLGILDRPGRPHADKHNIFEAQPTVFDLGDVIELGGEVRHSAER